MLSLRTLAIVTTSLACTLAGIGCAAPADGEAGVAEQHLEDKTVAAARFSPYLTNLKGALESGRTSEEIANMLLSSGRPNAFSLQALCRLYASRDPKFKEMRDDFKGLEDGIGGFDKWNGIFQSAVSEKKDAATITKLKAKKDAALADFTKLLTDRQWLPTAGSPGRIKLTEDFLKGFDFKSRAEDRKQVLGQMIKELDEIKSTPYDLTILENGNGIHELRRDIRWVLMEELGLAGVVTLKNDTCAVPAYASIPNDNRYGALRSNENEPNPCEVSQCLIFKAAKTVSDLGDLKDQAEIEVNINGDADVVPARLQPAAKAIQDDIVKNDLIGRYSGQLKACRDSL